MKIKNTKTRTLRVVLYVVLILLAFFSNRIRNDWVYRLATLGALLFSVLSVLKNTFGAPLGFLDYLPLSSLGFGWLLPSLVLGAIGFLLPGGTSSSQAYPAQDL